MTDTHQREEIRSEASDSPTRRTPRTRVRRYSRRFLITVAVMTALLVLARAALPYYLKRYVNDTLSRIPEYDGRVEEVDVHLWRGAYKIVGLNLVKESGQVRTPFFSAKAADLSVEWKALWDGALVGEIELRSPKLNFIQVEAKARSQTSIDKSFLDRAEELFPLRINRIRARNGEIRFQAPDRDPPVDVVITSIELTATNLTNSLRLSKTLNASFEGVGRVEGQAPITVNAEIDPYADIPTFDLDLELRSFDLTRINDLFRSWGGFDVEQGEMELFTELASSAKGFNGYIRPILTNLQVVSLERDSKNPIALAWEAIVASVVEIFTNQRRDQFAAEIPIRGTFEDPEAETWSAIISVVKNAFVEGLKPRLTGSVSFDTDRTERE